MTNPHLQSNSLLKPILDLDVISNIIWLYPYCIIKAQKRPCSFLYKKAIPLLFKLINWVIHHILWGLITIFLHSFNLFLHSFSNNATWKFRGFLFDLFLDTRILTTPSLGANLYQWPQFFRCSLFQEIDSLSTMQLWFEVEP